jgi:hypothetical protein
MSALIGGQQLPPPPVSVNYLAKMPAALGVMLNDSLGCCTCSAVYHAIQVWSFGASGQILTNPDADVLQIYESFCAYDPKDPNTDQGGDEQTVLTDWMIQGVPGVYGPDKLAAWIEVDVRNADDIKRTINSCGVCYIGFDVASNVMPDNADPPAIWQYDPKATSLGGHAVILAGYDAQYVNLISWGQKYQMTWEFFQKQTEEAYGLVDPNWVNTTGKTPLGMSVADLESLMSSMKMTGHRHA